MRAYIDKHGFFAGYTSYEGSERETFDAHPETFLIRPQAYQRVGTEWIIGTNYLGTYWYDPLNTQEIFTPTRFDDVPPRFHVQGLGGEIQPTPTELAALSKGLVFHKESRSWVNPASILELAQAKWVEVRKERDSLLVKSDFSQLPDVTSNKDAWAAYRQQLRDITSQPDPFNINWPSRPS